MSSKTELIKKVNDAIQTVNALEACLDASRDISFSKLVTLGLTLANQIELIAVGVKGTEKLQILETILHTALDELYAKSKITKDMYDRADSFIELTLPFAIQAACAVGKGLAPNLQGHVATLTKCCGF